MFKNVGKTIKALTIAVFAILMIGVMFLSSFCAKLVAGDLSDADPFLIVAAIFVFLLTLIVGGVIAYVMVLFVYAFGELVDTNQIQVEQNKKVISLLSRGFDEREEENKKLNEIQVIESEFGKAIDVSKQ